MMTEVEFQVFHFSPKTPWVFCTFTVAFKSFSLVVGKVLTPNLFINFALASVHKEL